jgi:hypothetical protein
MAALFALSTLVLAIVAFGSPPALAATVHAAKPAPPNPPVTPVTCDTQLAEARADLARVRWALDVEKRALAATCLRLHEAGEYSVVCDNGAR